MTEQHDEHPHDEHPHDEHPHDEHPYDDVAVDEPRMAPGSGAAVAHASQQQNPADGAEALGAERGTGLPSGLGDHATGDIVIDSALQDLKDAPADDLDAQIDAGQRVQQTLQARLSDLGGE